MNPKDSAFLDVIRLSQRTGRIPASIPDHYFKHAYAEHRKARGLIVPAVGWRHAAIHSTLVKLHCTE
jgi:hypothetical protein